MSLRHPVFRIRDSCFEPRFLREWCICIWNYRSLLQKRPMKETLFCKSGVYAYASDSYVDRSVAYAHCMRKRAPWTYELIHIRTSQHMNWCISSYGVATVSRIDQIIGLFCKRDLRKRRYSAKETYNFIDPTDRSHNIWADSYVDRSDAYDYAHFSFVCVPYNIGLCAL